jgi:hypothetical protein
VDPLNNVQPYGYHTKDSKVTKTSLSGPTEARPGYNLLTASGTRLLGAATIAPPTGTCDMIKTSHSKPARQGIKPDGNHFQAAYHEILVCGLHHGVNAAYPACLQSTLNVNKSNHFSHT